MSKVSPSETKGSILLIGNFPSDSCFISCVSESLYEHLVNSGWSICITSNKQNRLSRLIDMLNTIWRKKRQYNVAHVEVFSGKAFLLSEIVCSILRLLNKHYILTLHGGNLPSFARHWPKRVRNLLRSAVIVTSPSRYLLENMSDYRNDIVLLPNPLNLKAYKFTLRKKPLPHLIWLRGFHEFYNPSLAPKVIALLSDDFPDIKLKMIGQDKGDGSLQQTQQLSTKLNVANKINFPGGIPKTDVSVWMNKGDIFLNTTNVDNTPITVLEAMACGLCVVSTNVGGIPYLLENEKDVLLVPPDDPEAMAIAIKRILTNSNLAANLSRNARVKVETFDCSMILPQWETLLKQFQGDINHE